MTGPDVPSDPRAAIVSEWVGIAADDLDVAKRLMDDQDKRHRRAVAFHLQQAIEKLMKGVLISRGVRPPKTHDLDELAQLLAGAGVQLVATHDLSRLSEAAVESRYPGPPLTAADLLGLSRTAELLWSQLRPLV